MTRKLVNWAILFIAAIAFALYFYSFTTTSKNNLNASVSETTANGWELFEVADGVLQPVTPAEAMVSRGTIFMRRTVPESWASYDRIRIEGQRVVAVFVDNVPVHSTASATLSQSGELPLMRRDADLPYFFTFSNVPDWAGKTMTVVTRLYERNPCSMVYFELINENVLLTQHEVSVASHTLPGAMFGILSLLLVGLFLFQSSTAQKGHSILLLACASLLQTLFHMSSLTENPLPLMENDIVTALYFLFVLLYIGLKMQRMRRLYWITVLSVWGMFFSILIMLYYLHWPLPYWFDKVDILCLGLFVFLLVCCWKERKTNAFLRHFLFVLSMFFVGFGLLYAVAVVCNNPLTNFYTMLFMEAQGLYLRPLLFCVFTTILLALFILVVWDLLEDRIQIAKKMERLQTEQAMLRLQTQAAHEQLQTLRHSQQQAAIYRHDMRHHLTLLLGFAKEGDLQKMQEYLISTTADLDDLTPTQYCENETVNMILSALDAKAKKSGVALEVRTDLPRALNVSDTDLCALLSNALENAIAAAANVPDAALRSVELTITYKHGKVLILVKNPYVGTIVMEDGFPKSQNKEAGHGYGIKSMVSIVQQHGGLYAFRTDDGMFVLRLMLPVYAESHEMQPI